MKNNTENSAEAIMAAKASPGQDTLRLVFDPVPRAQVESTENSHSDVVVLDRGGQYDAIAIPIDFVAWKNDTDQKLASMQGALDDIVAWKSDTDPTLASMQRELASMKQEPASMKRELASTQRTLASMQRGIDIALECPVCFRHPTDMRLQCGHRFCQACVVQITTCPTCRQPVGESPPRRVFP